MSTQWEGRCAADGEPKIADFGLSCALARGQVDASERGGTSAFRAPEAWVRGQNNTVTADTGARWLTLTVGGHRTFKNATF